MDGNGYNTVSGVGVGGLNAYLYSIFGNKSSISIAKEMMDFWINISK